LLKKYIAPKNKKAHSSRFSMGIIRLLFCIVPGILKKERSYPACKHCLLSHFHCEALSLYIIIHDYYIKKTVGFQYFFEKKTECAMLIQSFYLKQSVLLRGHLEVKKA
jgi:hypothetical protein